ncbi:MAG TPA: hypothetical protein VLX91_05370, partial [Candidatus Acidoferrales bacterium]|nr:hypothetical protein [Candidatus Acidoferrales bacterium]
SRDSATNNFDRRLGQIKYRDVNGDGYLDVEKTVSQDVIHLTKNVDDFRKAQVMQHIASWTEVYLWDERILTFNLDKSKSSIDSE